MQRRLLKRAIDEAAKPAAPKGGAGNGRPIPTYVGDTVLRVPRQEGTDDRALLQQISRRVMEAIREGDRLTGEERQSHIENLLRGDSLNLAPRRSGELKFAGGDAAAC